jgi:hypothetical protein
MLHGKHRSQGGWGWPKQVSVAGKTLEYTGDVGSYHLYKSNPLEEAVKPEDKTEEVFPSAIGTID